MSLGIIVDPINMSNPTIFMYLWGLSLMTCYPFCKYVTVKSLNHISSQIQILTC